MKSVAEVAAEEGLTTRQVRDVLREHGVDIEASIIERAKAGASLKTLAEDYGYNTTHLSTIFRGAGLSKHDLNWRRAFAAV